MSLGEQQAITVDRGELKYEIEPEALTNFLRVLSSNLPLYHHGTAESALASLARHYTTTVYFDTESRALWQAASDSNPHIKLRAREYYDVLPLAELVAAEEELLRSAPILWLELKRREGDHSDKRRLGVPKRRLANFLRSPQVDPELRAIQRESLGAEGDQVLTEMLEFLAELGEPVMPSCIVNYARASWQNEEGLLRVTVDEDLAVYSPDASLWNRETVLTAKVLGTPVWRHRGAVVEVKSRTACPAWLSEALVDAGAIQTGRSKFVTASNALYGNDPPPTGKHP